MIKITLVAFLAVFLAASARAEVVAPLSALHRAAEIGIMEAQTELASHYLLGKKVARNPSLARSWYEKAANQGYSKAQTVLGWLYLEGSGGDVDAAVGAQWLRRAAVQGNPEAQLSLGTLYARGDGVAVSFIDSLMWLHLAVEKLPSGEMKIEARRWGNSVSRRMTREQIEEAVRLAKGIKAFD